MNKTQTKSSETQQAQIADAVDELKNSLAVAQKDLDDDLEMIKKNAMQEMENKENETEDISLKEIDEEIQAS